MVKSPHQTDATIRLPRKQRSTTVQRKNDPDATIQLPNKQHPTPVQNQPDSDATIRLRERMPIKQPERSAGRLVLTGSEPFRPSHVADTVPIARRFQEPIEQPVHRSQLRNVLLWLRRIISIFLLFTVIFLFINDMQQGQVNNLSNQEVASSPSSSISLPSIAELQDQARKRLQQLEQESKEWNTNNPYINPYDGKQYNLINGYGQSGITGILETKLNQASTRPELSVLLQDISNIQFHLQMAIENTRDQTPHNQMHTTDNQLLEYYNLASSHVLLISLTEQMMRIYDKSNLIKTIEITAGQQDRPSLPGLQGVLSRRSPLIFTSADAENSPLWFPDTEINYGLLYHDGDYYIHDAPWRSVFGPGTQFPHEDPAGTTSFNGTGSHGCINLSLENMEWLYSHTTWKTLILIY